MFIFSIQKARKANEPIIEIPPAIYSRMLTYSNVAIESANSYYGGGYFGLKVVNVDNKYYFAFVTEKKQAIPSDIIFVIIY